MRGNDTGYVLLIGVCLGWMIEAAVMALVPSSNYNVTKTELKKCEQNLPRSQKCVMIAVPETK